MRLVGFTALFALAVGCGDSAPTATGWRGAARDPGEAARIDREIGERLDAAAAKRVRETLDAMAAMPRTVAGVRAAAQLAVDGADKVVPDDWSGGGGNHPAASLLQDAALDVLAGLVAATAKGAKKRGDTARDDLIDAVAEIPLIRSYNSGGPLPDDDDRARLRAELEIVFGTLPSRGQPPATDWTAPGSGSGSGSNAGPVPPACTPVEPQQRAAHATVELSGDVVQSAVTVPAICGAFHTAATKRFAVGDGTLFRACLADGSTLSISADVLLVGKVKPLFTYADYKKTGPLVELNRPGVGTYNQRSEPSDADTLDIAFDWSKVTLSIDLPWPSKLDRVVHAVANFDCGGPMRANTWGP